MKYNKKPISIADQIAQLKSRGLIIEDENNAEKVLSIISYFRFANYLRPMEADKMTHKFKPGKKFNNALDLYYFDKTLRSVLFSAIQTVEIALRTSVIQHFSMKYGPFWFMKSKLFKDGEMHKACLKTIKTELKRTKEDFINDISQNTTNLACPRRGKRWKWFRLVHSANSIATLPTPQ